MARYKVLRGFCIKVGVDVYPGDVVQFDNRLNAESALRAGRVVLIEEESSTAPPRGAGARVGEETDEVPTGEPATPETREPRRSRR